MQDLPLSEGTAKFLSDCLNVDGEVGTFCFFPCSTDCTQRQTVPSSETAHAASLSRCSCLRRAWPTARSLYGHASDVLDSAGVGGPD